MAYLYLQNNTWTSGKFQKSLPIDIINEICSHTGPRLEWIKWWRANCMETIRHDRRYLVEIELYYKYIHAREMKRVFRRLNILESYRSGYNIMMYWRNRFVKPIHHFDVSWFSWPCLLMKV